MRRLVPLLLLAGCQQPLMDGLMPDELHLGGSQGWGDGDISTTGRDYDTSADGYRVAVGLTWDLGPPPKDLEPALERIARAVERPESAPAPFVVVPPTASPPAASEATEGQGEGEGDHWVQTGKALGGIATLIGLIWAAIRQNRKNSSPDEWDPSDPGAAD